ncbi:MAG: AprI/Inh family metalloprotease inhibitor [Alphaproteobacteria bacterium]|nr:AprI/Inh family metalloprotease inhibitor [Alphaproteobacteria bacterium]
MTRMLLALVLMASPAFAADPLAPPRTVEEMLGDVGVMNAAGEDLCSIILYEDEVPGGYRLEQYPGCEKPFPVMARVKAWRVYGNGEMTFADAAGHDLVRFRGKPFTFTAVEPVDGIAKIWSAQEVAE